MHLKLVYPTSGAWYDQQPENEGFEPTAIIARLDDLREHGHSYQVLDGDAMDDAKRDRLYLGEALVAVAHAGNRYSVRQVLGSNKHPGGATGKGDPVLIVSEDGEPVDVYPHRDRDGSLHTIRTFLDSL